MSSTTVPNPANGSFPSRSSRLSTGCCPEEKDDNPTGQRGKAVENVVEGQELAKIDQVLCFST